MRSPLFNDNESVFSNQVIEQTLLEYPLNQSKIAQYEARFASLFMLLRNIHMNAKDTKQSQQTDNCIKSKESI